MKTVFYVGAAMWCFVVVWVSLYEALGARRGRHRTHSARSGHSVPAGEVIDPGVSDPTSPAHSTQYCRARSALFYRGTSARALRALFVSKDARLFIYTYIIAVYIMYK